MIIPTYIVGSVCKNITPGHTGFKKETAREPLKQVLHPTYLVVSRYHTLVSILVIDHIVNETQ